MYDLLEAIAKDKVPTPNFEDGVRNQKVLAAMEKAAVTRRWVKCDEIADCRVHD